MAIATPDFLQALLTNYRAYFEKEFLAAMNMAEWTEISARIESSTNIESYDWFGTVPVMQDTTSTPLTFRDMPSYSFSIQNHDWQNGIALKRSAIEDDKYNLLLPRVSQLAQEAVRHPGELILKLFEGNPTAYDGTAFFSTTRTIGFSGNINNIVTGTASAGSPYVYTVAQFQTDLAAARSTMRLFQDDEGRPQNAVGETLVVPPQLEQLAYQSLNANQGTINQPIVPSNTEKLYRQKGYSVVVDPYLTRSQDWYLLYCRGGYRPFIFQSRLAPALEGIIRPDNEIAIIKGEYWYTSRARYNVGVADPRYAVRIANS